VALCYHALDMVRVAVIVVTHAYHLEAIIWKKPWVPMMMAAVVLSRIDDDGISDANSWMCGQ